MHNIEVRPDEPESWARIKIVSLIEYHTRQANRYANLLEAFSYRGDTFSKETYENLLAEQLEVIARLYDRHFHVTDAASVQHVSHETEGAAA